MVIGRQLQLEAKHTSDRLFTGYVCNRFPRLGLYPISTLAVTWATNTFSPDSKRAIAMPLVFTMADISSMVSSQLYPSTQAPRYIQGNAVSAGLTCVAGILYTASWYLLRFRNKRKQRLLAEGATTNHMEGDRSLDSMYIL